MDTGLLVEKFALMGARLQFREIVNNFRWRRESPGIDIRTDERGEFFDIRTERDERVEYEVVDLRPDMRHLLLLGRREGKKEKYLCGHDERHWFVCAVPGASVRGVTTAMESLQPPLVRLAINRNLRRQKNRLRRRNEAFVRQGEWFFVPAPDLSVPAWLVLRNEPLSRGAGSKPHTCQFAYRRGGEQVWVCARFPSGLPDASYRHLLATDRRARRWDWRQMVREPEVYVKGRVWHRDHKTVVLEGWHRVAMNTEREAPFAPRVVFLD
ncbi:MAG TPA: hypothetical protein VJ866_21270 [Pyrinomonadaceae bacterium]|nr:hypothetical protein [Pyrinomonadaceae bacterium]